MAHERSEENLLSFGGYQNTGSRQSHLTIIIFNIWPLQRFQVWFQLAPVDQI